MAGGAISINIGGNAQQLTQAAGQASNALNGFAGAATAAAVGLSRAFNTVATSATATGTAMNRLAPAMRPVLTNLTVIPPAANAAGNSLARLRGQSGQAGAALTDVSRIIQDAPFGIIGIGNNITQLSESFGRLRATAGSTGAAFRQLFTSAGGFGGIGLAISVLTTAFTFASVGFSAWTRGMTSAKKAADEAKKAVEEFVKGLRSVNDVAGQATGGVQGQIAQVQALANAVTDSKKPYDQRAAALRELGQINKSYFGDLKLEEGQMATLTARVKEYTQALIQQAVVKGFENEVGKLSTELYDQEKALKKSSQAIRNLEGDVAAANKTGKVFNQGYVDLKIKLDESTKAFKLQRDAVTRGKENLLLLKDAMGKAVEEGLKFRDLTNNKTKTSKQEDAALKSLRKELAGYERQLKDIDELRKQGALPINAENDALALQLKIFETLGKIDAREVEIKVKPELEINPKVLDLQIAEALREAAVRASAGAKAVKIPFLTRFTFSDKSSANLFSPSDILGPENISPEVFDGVIKRIQANAALSLAELRKNLGDNLRETLRLGIIEGLTGAGEALGAAIAGIFNGESVGSALAAAGEGILKIIGGVLQDMGKQIILASVLVQSLKKALASLFANPTAALGVGIALVAAGGLLKSIKFGGRSTPGFADGVTGFTGGAALVGERGPEILTLPAGSNITPLSPFQESRTPPPSLFARGDDLYLVYNRTAGRRRRV